MKEWLEYKLSKKQLIVYLIIYFSMMAVFGGMAIYFFFSSMEHGKKLAVVPLIPLILTSLIIIPVVIINVIDLYRLKAISRHCEYYTVRFENLHSYFTGFYFSLKIMKDNGEILRGDTRAMFTRYGVRSYENYINTNVNIAVGQNSKIVVVGIAEVNDEGNKN